MDIKIWIYALGSVLAVSLLSLVGIFTLSISTKKLNRILHILVSFAVGTLFGAVFIHILPEVFSSVEGATITPSFYILVGILIFFVLEKFIRWRHCHDVDCEEHSIHLVPINLVGDALHNLIDGLIIGAAYVVNIPLGVATTVAVAFHEIPQEIGDFGVLLQGGLNVKKALLYNFLTALTSLLGVTIALLTGQNISLFIHVLMPITAGGFIYIAGSDLIPELHKNHEQQKALTQLAFLILGLGVMFFLKRI